MHTTVSCPVSKSKAAFLLSAAQLFRQSKKVYFWTFTFERVEYDERAMFLWSQFMARMAKFYHGNYPGLRVVEVHPGEYSHGLHFHALIGRRLSIHIVKRLAKRWGFGRIAVVEADEGTALYLAKYISKENDVAPGIRRWAAIGGYKNVTVRNMQCESVFARNIRWVQNHCKVNKFGYAFFLYLSKQSRLYGPLRKWPTRSRLTPEAMKCKTVKDIEQLPDDLGIYYTMVPADRWLPATHFRAKTNTGWVTVDSEARPF